MNATIKLDSYEACRTNTGRAMENDLHYNFSMLAKISGANFEGVLADLNWCAQQPDGDEDAIQTIKNLANSLLSAYEIQRDSYKKHPSN